MELRALIEGYRFLAADEDLPVFTDSQLCVNTITKWAAKWERNGWTRRKKRAEVKNLDLVRELYDLSKYRPRAKLQWIRGHEGSRWNKYADSLSRAYQSR
jgi:ribonuclease HI